MLVVPMAHQHRTMDPPRPATNRDYGSPLNHWVGMPQLSHVAASVWALLKMRDVDAMGWVGGTRGSRFRKSSGGQAKNQQKIKNSFQELSVHR
jgi:hypothetical protein